MNVLDGGLVNPVGPLVSPAKGIGRTVSVGAALAGGAASSSAASAIPARVVMLRGIEAVRNMVHPLSGVELRVAGRIRCWSRVWQRLPKPPRCY